MTMIRFENVSYRVGEEAIVQDLNLEIAEGETVVLLGQSGSGKTTTLKLINHLLIPTEGSVFVKQTATRDWDPIRLRRMIGYVIQEIGLFPHFTVFENVGLVPGLEKWEESRMQARIAEVLDLVGLDPSIYGKRYPHQLSGGQRQRVGVARAICADPPILLLDEPFGSLDPISRSEIQNEFRQLQKRLGKTVVFVTHDVAGAMLIGHRIGLMRNGSMVALASRSDFLNSQDSEIRSYLKPLENILSMIGELQS
jgi:osmoprotectant transport system ATP-binding protein